MGGSIPPPSRLTVPCTQSLLCIPTKHTQYVTHVCHQLHPTCFGVRHTILREALAALLLTNCMLFCSAVTQVVL
jgi:hypothetical protein